MNKTKNIWTGLLLLSLMMIGFLSMRFIVTSGAEIKGSNALNQSLDRSFSESLEDIFDD